MIDSPWTIPNQWAAKLVDWPCVRNLNLPEVKQGTTTMCRKKLFSVDHDILELSVGGCDPCRALELEVNWIIQLNLLGTFRPTKYSVVVLSSSKV